MSILSANSRAFDLHAVAEMTVYVFWLVLRGFFKLAGRVRLRDLLKNGREDRTPGTKLAQGVLLAEGCS